MRSFILATAAATLMMSAATVALPAAAFETKPFDAASFATAQKAGQAVVVHVTAPWCPTCKAQEQVLKPLEGNPAYAKLTILTVDFDSQKDVLKTFNVQHQSTLIGFKGVAETGRIVGDTRAQSIETLLASTLK